MAYYSDAIAELISEVGCTCGTHEEQPLEEHTCIAARAEMAWRDLRAERDRLQRGMDDALAQAEKAKAEAISRRTTAYICAACGGIAYAEIDSLDSGTTLTCDRCRGKTVVDLDTPEAWTARYHIIQRQQAELDRLRLKCDEARRKLTRVRRER